MTRMHSTGRVVVRVLCIAGLLVLGYVTYVVVDAKIYRPIEHRQLEKASPSAVARAIGHPARIFSRTLFDRATGAASEGSWRYSQSFDSPGMHRPLIGEDRMDA